MESRVFYIEGFPWVSRTDFDYIWNDMPHNQVKVTTTVFTPVFVIGGELR